MKKVLMISCFQKGKKKDAVQTSKKICALSGNDVIAEKRVLNCLRRFTSGNFNLDGWESAGRFAVVGDDRIEAKF